MYIGEQFRENVFYIGHRTNEEPRWAGTGFIVGTPSAAPGKAYHYVVTAKHVIEKIRKGTLDGRVLLRMNHVDGTAGEYETALDDWVSHPVEHSVDISIAPIWLGDAIAQKAIPIESFKGELPAWIRPGTEVFSPGLFYFHPGQKKNLPIARIGALAAVPEEPIYQGLIGAWVETYLVEARSTGGLSGSPVFAYRETPTGRFSTDWEVHLLGVMSGHFDDPEKINMGLAMVVPLRLLLEVIEQPIFRDHRISEGAPW